MQPGHIWPEHRLCTPVLRRLQLRLHGGASAVEPADGALVEGRPLEGDEQRVLHEHAGVQVAVLVHPGAERVADVLVPAATAVITGPRRRG